MDWDMFLELIGGPRKRGPDQVRYDDEAERERLAAAEENPRALRPPSGGGQLAVPPDPESDDLMALLSRIREEEIINDPLDPVNGMTDVVRRRDTAVGDMQTLQAAREARFGPAPPPSDPEQVALLDRAQAQSGPAPVPNPVPQTTFPFTIGQNEIQQSLGAPSPAPAPQPQPQAQPTQPQQASVASPRGGPQETAPAAPPDIDLGKIFAEVIQNLSSQGPMLQATPETRPQAPQPSGPAGPPRPGIQARASAAAPEPPPFLGVFAQPRTQIGPPPASVMPPPAARTDPRAQVAPQHFQFPYQAGPGASPPPVQIQAQTPTRPPTQIGADFQAPPVQSSADVLNLAEAQRIRERGGPSNVPFDQGLPGLPSDQMPGPVSTPEAPALRSAPKPGSIPAEVPNSSVQKPKPNSGMGTEAPADLKEALLLEALRLSQKRRNPQPQAAGAM